MVAIGITPMTSTIWAQIERSIAELRSRAPSLESTTAGTWVTFYFPHGERMGTVGIEPTTHRLSSDCSSAELRSHGIKFSSFCQWRNHQLHP